MFIKTTDVMLNLIVYIILTFSHLKSVSTTATEDLCDMRTDDFCKYYGYGAETHSVVTEDGYIITIFRCNSIESSPKRKKPVIIQHGLFISSDDFVINPPKLSLAYVLADAGYDVWLPNSRGNFYSRDHVVKDPNSIFSDYWDFSWYELGIYDQPAVIDYILEQTKFPKLYYVGFSQGTTSILVLLSEKPEYNDKIQVASLLAPAAYMTHSESVFKLPGILSPLLNSVQGFELFSRNGVLSHVLHKYCALGNWICNIAVDNFFGPSDKLRSNRLLPVFICHIGSGASFKQFNHYSQETRHMFFGKYMTDSRVPQDFELSRITAPISVHYSTSDRITNATDAETLIPKLKSVIFVQRVDTPRINHMDFAWSRVSASLIYTNILKVFQRYQ